MWGEWSVAIDPGTLEIEAAPERSEAAHWNVTGMVQAPSCPGCVAFKNAHMSEPGVLSVTVELTHPFGDKPSLDAFDVRGIVYGPPVLTFPSGTVSGLLANADGCCARWSHDPWAKINPYIAFATDDPERRFKAGSNHERECLIGMPGKGALKFDFAIDACWLPPKKVDLGNPSLSPHCNEAWDVNCDVSGPIDGHEGAFARLLVTVHDWQGDGEGAKVSIEAPNLIGVAMQAEWNGQMSPPGFDCSMENSLNAAPGSYPVLICVRDVLNTQPADMLATFMPATIVVTSATPAISGIEVFPKAQVLNDKGSSAQFAASAKFADGGMAWVKDGIDWSVTGTDLNGAALAEIDSAGLAKRLTSKWWGGTATMHAQYEGFKGEATAYCPDSFADSASVKFGKFCEEGGTYTQVKSLLGPPEGLGELAGGTDICSLGYGGIATLEFVNNTIVDGPGPDFIVFENAFYSGGCDWKGEPQHVTWCETAIVEISQDGLQWHRFPPDYNPSNKTCGIEPWANASSFKNLAGVHPVIASVAHDGTLKDGVDPTDPATAGGDAFDLAAVGLSWCRYVRLIDTGDSVDAPGTEQHDVDGDLILDYGKQSPLGAQQGQAGFDCDSVAAIHSGDPIGIDK
jgi:hypothetical protein